MWRRSVQLRCYGTTCCAVTMYGKHFYGMGGPTYGADNPYMDMEYLITLDDAVAALHAQLNAPSRRS